MASPRRPLHSLLSCLALGWLLLHPPTAQADSGECFPSQLKLDIEPLLAEARVALIAQNWTEALRLSRVLQSRIPCVQEPVPASLLSRLFLYEATRAWSQGDQAQSRELLDLALGFFPELEWDSELADARTMLPFLTELEARRVVLQREAPAQLLVQSVGKDQQLYLDGVPYPRSKTPIPVRAGEHLVQQLQRSGKWQGRWLNLKSAETLALEPSFLAAPAAKPLWAMNLSMGQQWRPTLTAEVAVTTQGLSLGMGRALAERSQLWASVGVGYAASGGLSQDQEQLLGGPCPVSYRGGVDYLHRLSAGGLWLGGGLGVMAGCLDWSSSSAAGFSIGRALGITPEGVLSLAWRPAASAGPSGLPLGVRLELAGGPTFHNLEAAEELESTPLSLRVNLGLWLVWDARRL